MQKRGEVLLLSADDVADVLTPSDCLERCIDTFKWVGEGKVDQVNPVNLWFSPEGPYGWGYMQAFPSHIKPLKIAGIKWHGGSKNNRERGLPYRIAVNIINDTETTMPLAIIDGSSVTAMRTAGHSGVGAKYLARKDSRVIAIIGCGVQAHTHLRMMNTLFDIEEVRVVDIIKEMRDSFQKEMSEELKLNIRIVESAQEAVKGADVVCMLATAREPVVKEEWIKPGCHVCETMGFMDLDPNCAVKFDKWVVGWYGRDLEWIEGPEKGILSPKVVPYTRENIYADLATEIVQGKKPGRESAEERTVMTHLGMPALDAATCALVYEKAKEKGVGAIFKMF